MYLARNGPGTRRKGSNIGLNKRKRRRRAAHIPATNPIWGEKSAVAIAISVGSERLVMSATTEKKKPDAR